MFKKVFHKYIEVMSTAVNSAVFRVVKLINRNSTPCTKLVDELKIVTDLKGRGW